MSNKNFILKINSRFKNLGEFIVKNNYKLIVLSVITVIVCGIGLQNLQIGLDLDNYFTEDDPILLNKKNFNEQFGNSDFIGILVESENVFDREILKAIRDISNTVLDSVPYAKEVISLTNLEYLVPVKPMSPIKGSVFNTASIDIDSISDTELNKIKDMFDKREGIKGKLYSHDYTQTWIILRLENYPNTENWNMKQSPIEYIGEKAYKTLENKNKEYSAKLTDSKFNIIAAGSPIVVYRRNAETLPEMIRIIIFAAIISVIMIILMTRSFRASIGIITTVISALVIVFGIKGYMHEMIDSAFMLIPILLTIAVAVAYSIHLTTYYRKVLQSTKDSKEAIVIAMEKNGWPILFATITTIVALTSFQFVPISTIKWAGTTAGLSIFVVYILLMFFYPAILSLSSKKDKNLRVDKNDNWSKILEKLSIIVLNNKKPIIISFSILLIVMLIFSFRIKVNLNPKEMFGTKMPHAKDMIYVNESEIASNYYYNICIDSDEKDFFKKLENIEKIKLIENEILKSEISASTTSLADKVSEMHQALRRDNPEYFRLPAKQSLLNSLIKRLEKYTNDNMRRTVTEDYSSTQIFVAMSDFESKLFIEHIDSIVNKVEELFPEEDNPELSTILTGYAIQFGKMNQYVTSGLIRSLLVSLLIVFLLMSIAFNNIKLGLIAMLPNIAPVLVVGGLMGMFNIPLEFITMTIAPMILGLAVDNTIHLINGTKLEFLKTKSYSKSIKNTYQTVGQALIKSSIILCLTLLTFSFSVMNNMINMGILTAIAIFVATITDFLLTPTLIRIVKPFGKED